jgi:hypothetical protein
MNPPLLKTCEETAVIKLQSAGHHDEFASKMTLKYGIVLILSMQTNIINKRINDTAHRRNASIFANQFI